MIAHVQEGKAPEQVRTETWPFLCPPLRARSTPRTTLLRTVEVDRFVIATNIPSLYLLTAGRFDDAYSGRVASFDWAGLYTRFPSLMQWFAERLSEQYDYVLIDSRTGVSDISGICTALLPEKLALIFTPNRQSLFGGLQAVHLASEYRRQSDDLRSIIVFPVPSRIEPAEAQLRREWRFGGGRSEFEGYQRLWEQSFRELYGLADCDLGPYFDEVMIPHVPYYAYGEEIAVLLENAEDPLSLASAYQRLSGWLTGDVAPWDLPATPRARG